MTFGNKQSGVTRVDSEVSIPEKAALTTIRVFPPTDGDSQYNSAVSTPRSDRTTTNPFETDIEALASHSSIDRTCRKSLAIETKTDCQVWPGKDHWKKQAKEAKMKRSWSCMARLSRRNRIICKLLLILLVVGIAVSVGFGVSKPLGAPIWGKKPDDS
ncbi:hypothetical protein PT974_07515 [Cladobotryum mycophilum]|uniref:Uncharacterized protein n=1 Tax=Cladobotryum mycophilum TaxID=491253 RepID=A0ABR0SPH7_9HYPO